MDYSIQLYSVEDYVSETSLEEGIRAVAQMGYKYVEFCEYHGHTAEEIKGFMDKYGVKCSAAHLHEDVLLPDKFDETVAFHKILGCDTFIIPCCDWSTPEKKKDLIAKFNDIDKRLKAIGMHFAFHNHDGEFLKVDDGTTFAEDVLTKTEMELEIDTFWLYNARIDTIEFLNKYKDRVRFLHLKDGIACKEKDFYFGNHRVGVEDRPVGYGETDIKAIHDWAIKNDVMMVVECENSGRVSLDYSKQSIEYLKTLD